MKFVIASFQSSFGMELPSFPLTLISTTSAFLVKGKRVSGSRQRFWYSYRSA